MRLREFRSIPCILVALKSLCSLTVDLSQICVFGLVCAEGTKHSEFGFPPLCILGEFGLSFLVSLKAIYSLTVDNS